MYVDIQVRVLVGRFRTYKMIDLGKASQVFHTQERSRMPARAVPQSFTNLFSPQHSRQGTVHFRQRLFEIVIAHLL